MIPAPPIDPWSQTHVPKGSRRRIRLDAGEHVADPDMSPTGTPPVIIGWREWIELPDWGVRLRAKIDTGARSSSIDVAELVLLPDDRVQFAIRMSRRKESVIHVETLIASRARVRSSNGQTQDRIMVKTTLRLGGVEKPILISLACRKKMLHRMLLGREAMRDHFLIAAGADYLALGPRTASAKSRHK